MLTPSQASVLNDIEGDGMDLDASMMAAPVADAVEEDHKVKAKKEKKDKKDKSEKKEKKRKRESEVGVADEAAAVNGDSDKKKKKKKSKHDD